MSSLCVVVVDTFYQPCNLFDEANALYNDRMLMLSPFNTASSNLFNEAGAVSLHRGQLQFVQLGR